MTDLASLAGRIIWRRVKAVPFVLRDATRCVIVDPEVVTALLRVHHSWSS